MPSRRDFLQQSFTVTAGACLLPAAILPAANLEIIMTVNGPVTADKMGFTLSHEHVLCDFSGAEKYSPANHRAGEVYAKALPFLTDVKNKGCQTFIDCSPAYIGRDAQLLKRLAAQTGLHIITNTGFYGAAGEKYLPKQVYTTNADAIARGWTAEFKDGIEGTSVRPGFIKTGVDKAPLSKAQQKIIEAAAITHLATGLTIAIHTGDGEAAKEQLRILTAQGVSPAARIWVHAQNEPEMKYHLDAAAGNSWVSFDGVNKENTAI